jgi:hypothetical protein
MGWQQTPMVSMFTNGSPIGFLPWPFFIQQNEMSFRIYFTLGMNLAQFSQDTCRMGQLGRTSRALFNTIRVVFLWVFEYIPQCKENPPFRGSFEPGSYLSLVTPGRGQFPLRKKPVSHSGKKNHSVTTPPPRRGVCREPGEVSQFLDPIFGPKRGLNGTFVNLLCFIWHFQCQTFLTFSTLDPK